MRKYGFMEPREQSPVTVRRLDPDALLTPMPARQCVRCGRNGTLESTPRGLMHDACMPAPAPEPPQVLQLPTRPRTTHLTRRDQARVLEWLDERGPATARMVAWALELVPREVQLLLHELEGVRVESVGVLVTGRRGHPPSLWRVRSSAPETVAA